MPNEEKPQLMLAEFLMPIDRLRDIAERDAKKTDSEVNVELKSMGNGFLTIAVGPIQSVMFLVGAVAAEGEAALYRAGLV